MARVQGQSIKIWDPIPNFGTGQTRHLKFSVLIDDGKYHLMDDKLSQMGVVRVQGPSLKIWDSA